MSTHGVSPLHLRSGTASAAIYPDAGGRLGQLDFGSGALLRGPAANRDWAHWGCFPLLPWSNRITGGHLLFGDIDAHFPINFPDGSAIHGLTASSPWTVLRSSDHAAELETMASSSPYRVRGRQVFELEPDRLHLHLSATNQGDQPVPVGIGIHPWFRTGRIQVAADMRWPGEPLPIGPPEPVTGQYDLREGAVPAVMDACFTALTDSVAEVPGAKLHWDGPITNVVVYSGEAGWVCVEPVTMANGAFDLAPEQAIARGVQVLEPGATIEVRYRFERDDETPDPLT